MLEPDDLSWFLSQEEKPLPVIATDGLSFDTAIELLEYMAYSVQAHGKKSLENPSFSHHARMILDYVAQHFGSKDFQDKLFPWNEMAILPVAGLESAWDHCIVSILEKVDTVTLPADWCKYRIFDLAFAHADRIALRWHLLDSIDSAVNARKESGFIYTTPSFYYEKLRAQLANLTIADIADAGPTREFALLMAYGNQSISLSEELANHLINNYIKLNPGLPGPQTPRLLLAFCSRANSFDQCQPILQAYLEQQRSPDTQSIFALHWLMLMWGRSLTDFGLDEASIQRYQLTDDQIIQLYSETRTDPNEDYFFLGIKADAAATLMMLMVYLVFTPQFQLDSDHPRGFFNWIPTTSEIKEIYFSLLFHTEDKHGDPIYHLIRHHLPAYWQHLKNYFQQESLPEAIQYRVVKLLVETRELTLLHLLFSRGVSPNLRPHLGPSIPSLTAQIGGEDLIDLMYLHGANFNQIGHGDRTSHLMDCEQIFYGESGDQFKALQQKLHIPSTRPRFRFRRSVTISRQVPQEPPRLSREVTQFLICCLFRLLCTEQRDGDEFAVKLATWQRHEAEIRSRVTNHRSDYRLLKLMEFLPNPEPAKDSMIGYSCHDCGIEPGADLLAFLDKLPFNPPDQSVGLLSAQTKRLKLS